MKAGARLFRRSAAIAFIPVAIGSGLAGLTSSIGGKVPALAETGLTYDGTALAEIEGVSVLAASIEGRAGSDAPPLSPEVERRLLMAYRAEPLNKAAYRSLALLMRERKDDRYDTFVDAALAASPRTPSLIGLALESAAQDGDNTLALNLLDRLMRVRPSTVRELMPQLVAQLEQNPNVAEMQQILALQPLWAPIFFSLAANSEILLPIVAEIRLSLGETASSNEAIDARYIANLGATGDYAAAWRIFSLRRTANDDSYLQFDTQYPPFDWTLAASADQTASLLPGNALEIDMLSGGGEAARQTVHLPPGRWQIEADVDRDGPGSNVVTVGAACAGEANTGEVARLGTDATSLSAALPANCRFVTLSFTTERSYSTVPTIVTLRNLRLSPATF